jgi:hypothetical protein
MNKLLEIFSIGNAADLFARLRGWSPAGRSIVLTSAEGPQSDALGDRVFAIREVREGDLLVGDQQEAGYLLRPRHRGWTARSLMATSIAVTVHELGTHGPGDAIAIAVARLSKPA